MTPITSTQCHGNSTPHTHPNRTTASHGTRSRTKRYPHYTQHIHNTHLRPALASTLEPSPVPLETCHPVQITGIVDGFETNAQQVHGTHLVLCIHIHSRRNQLHRRLQPSGLHGRMKSGPSTLPIPFNKHINFDSTTFNASTIT
jgi:hypothetical protein